MAYNQNFYNNLQENNFTFQRHYPMSFPIPPPPAFYPCNAQISQISDQDFLKTFEKNLNESLPKVKPNITITKLKSKLMSLLTSHRELTEQYEKLSKNIDNFTNIEWTSVMSDVACKKEEIKKRIEEFNGSYMEEARKYLAKRTAKRQRLKRLNNKRKQQKLEWFKEMKEKSSKIDENLQKIKDYNLKEKKKEEAKLNADLILRDVQRKKNDAKKCINKLEALLKLRQARQNTAKGMGHNISEADTIVFEKNIEKLKSLWTQRLDIYNKEEITLQSQLTSTKDEPLNETAKNIDNILDEWREVLFGGINPQVNFGGNVERFIAVRKQWDAYISSDGSALPIGWVVNN
ncbi:U11/U12 small nuclear ribonucleoprotein 59 kDa protein-like [Pieris rapae]|uniref:U11/U12 small nuclear ribonucleoprotein 59 kDa protein-like n=1 Tax=Pieris rapae TaxID=64459 RepID=UPI001E2818E5|nr:U11/U12 small nuclear ribonucleoprotein 59 kDa protein-like [Pieris rapae]